MNYKEIIISDPDIMVGKLIIKGTRITVEHILKKLSEGMTNQEYIEAYPQITENDIKAVLEYSADIVSREEVIA